MDLASTGTKDQCTTRPEIVYEAPAGDRSLPPSPGQHRLDHSTTHARKLLRPSEAGAPVWANFQAPSRACHLLSRLWRPGLSRGRLGSTCAPLVARVEVSRHGPRTEQAQHGNHGQHSSHFISHTCYPFLYAIAKWPLSLLKALPLQWAGRAKRPRVLYHFSFPWSNLINTPH